ncbi:solute carrier family 2 member 9, like 1 isoform X2 [Brienomyrus brachyistius]|uniref:solute carrier family 2 member 9, like 1 isoform X2 n=1 Tax=Brienomyrus brachyistius TaxID=42636 RepID=UPI0020B39BDF|nr:solute carrier family 2 member 9, like 1 isoform X2 [Brienomyrus brachyistius]
MEVQYVIRGKALFFIIVLGIGGSFQNGFHVTVISSPSPYIQDFINRSWFERYEEPLPKYSLTFIWSAAVSLYGVGGLIGSMCVKYFAGRFGRKGALMWNDAISIVSALIMFSSKFLNSFEMVILARFSYGFAAGLGLFVHMMYLGESSPTKLRGMVTLTSATFFAIGKLSGQLAGLKEFLGHESLWNVLLSVPGILAFIQLVALQFLPEAPRYLLIDKDNKEMCQKALQTLWGVGEYKVEIEEMMLEQVAIKGQPSKSLVGLLRDHLVRWQLVTIMVITFSIQFSGLSAIGSFSYSLLMEAGIPTDKIRYVTLGLGVSEVMTSIVCGFLIDNLGRRSLLWKGFVVMSALMALVGLTQLLKGNSYWIPYSTVGLIFLFLIFCGGPTGVMPPFSHEIFVQSYRPAAFVFSGILRWLGFFIMGMVFPFLLASLKSFSFLLFASVCLLGALYVFFLVPETKGKTLLEISEEFKKIHIYRPSLSKDVVLETRL